jgi:transcriptional regulator with AAA-type ATPase domain/transcriptional regulatory protein LevR
MINAMKRIDTVYSRLCELSGETGITTIELAEALALARPNVSDDLNRLCDEGRAIKEGTKPVRYRAIVREKPESVIDQFAKKFPSLAQATEQAKAAVLYPPHGMPILVLGETGTGKSLFAKLVHSYTCETRGDDGIPFVVFNCADYADNPSLLVSILFGARKGAYTGADSDRQGLIEKADGGMLFLDEIHRLPPEGQEMLFTFLDRGKYRRLGDAETELSANVGIIAATTESPESALLRTFVRRIPMVIKLPSLADRGIDERLELIRDFYEAEADRLGMPIHASVNSVRSLLGYPCPNNVGQLKTDVQLLCARAYSDYVSKKKPTVQIVTASLPPHIKEGLFSATTHREIWNKLTDVDSRFCVFGPGERDDRTTFDQKDRLNIYELIDLRVREMRTGCVQETDIERNLDEYIRSYFSRFCSYQGETTTLDTILSMADEDVAQSIVEIVRFAEAKLEREFPPPIKTGIAMHVMNAIQRVKAGKQIGAKEFNRIRRDHPAEFATAVECLTIIDHTCEISMPLEEASFLAFFFLLDEDRAAGAGFRPVRVVVLAHGDSTATSMAKACNGLLNMTIAEGIDVPLNEPPSTAWDRLRALVGSGEEKPDVLLLVDMGSLTNLGHMLETELGVKSRTIPMASTLHVLQAVRKAAEGLPLDRIYEAVRDIRDALTAEPKEREKDTAKKRYIITLCATGEGTALMLRDQLMDRLSFDRKGIQIINLGIGNSGDGNIGERLARIGRSGEILFIVSPFRVDADIPQFTVEDIVGSGIGSMQELLDRSALLDKISAAYADFFSTIDSGEAIEAANRVIGRVEKECGRTLLDSVRTGIFCHIACMLDRLKSDIPTPTFTDMDTFVDENQTLFNIVRAEATALESKFDVAIPDDEICRIVSFFHPENCVL